MDSRLTHSVVPQPERTILTETESLKQPPTSGDLRQHSIEKRKETDSLPAEWKTWPDFMLRLDGLPAGVTTANIWDWFSGQGEIAYIDIFEFRGGNSAKIRFEPPPARDFWRTGTYKVSNTDKLDGAKELSILVKPLSELRHNWIRSPVCFERQHPVKTVLYPKDIQIGSLIGPQAIKLMRSISAISPTGDSSLKIEVNLKLRCLTAFFPFEVASGFSKYIREYKMVLDFSQIMAAYRTTNENGAALVLASRYPPRYYWKSMDMRSTLTDATNWNATEGWNRATDMVENDCLTLRYPVALHTAELQGPNSIDIGRWTAFRFPFKCETREFNQLIAAMEDFNVMHQIANNFHVEFGAVAEMWKHLDHPAVTEGNAFNLLQLTNASTAPLNFEVRYQLEVCVSKGLINEQVISVEFLNRLAAMDPLKARLMLEYLADQDEAIFNPMGIFEDVDARSYFPRTRIPHYCALVRKVVITPTSIRFSTPAVEASNRVMRRYSHIQDRFLRIQFVEELEKGRITINKDQNDEIWKRVLRTLYKGIRIGDRVYEFLAFGSSQLRQCGAYFFCPTDHISCDSIRSWMGQFNHIKVVAKYAARLGQCFSTTREIRGISVPKIREVPDIETGNYCFTDGVGMISPFIAQMVIEDMGLEVFDQPSAFQFRMGGCKGVLAVWPGAAKGTEVHIRRSQKKFEADFKGLEIIRCAKFATATLNRQTITILESLGVPTAAFVTLLNEQLRSYERSMTDDRAAIEMLTKFVDENQTTLVIAELLKAGFRAQTMEPFVVNVLQLWRSWSLKLLKEKARIQVENSAFVIGCVDESGTLRGHDATTEGSAEKNVSRLPQIFLQISDPQGYDQTQVITGVCIVGRNPSLHPGDIRIVQAVDNPELYHLKDVVVFPSQGDRPVPNMLSGGDLDGDDFFVIWEPSLMPKRWNYPPMDYSAPAPLKLDRDVGVDDLRNFFVKYMKNDTLPLIATAHLALSDKYGPMSPRCLKLAALHSHAVDFPKTGDPAILRRDQQPTIWPHFMEKKRQYHSRKALGVIYDRVVNKAVQFKPTWGSPFDSRVLSRYEIDDEMRESAMKIKKDYDTCVRRLLSQHSLETEFELWTGFAMSKPAIGSDYKRQEDLGREYDALKHRFREICYEAAGGKGNEQIDRFVAAMYMVTAEENMNAQAGNESGHMLQERGPQTKLISFPWIFPWVLARVALGRSYNPTKSLLAGAHGKPGHPIPQNHQPPPGSGEPIEDLGPDGKLKDAAVHGNAPPPSLLEPVEGLDTEVASERQTEDGSGRREEGATGAVTYAQTAGEADVPEISAISRLELLMGGFGGSEEE